VISLASAAAAIILSHRFGRTHRTDGFLIAYSVYLVLTLAASAFRVVALPPLTRARTEERFGSELAGFAAVLAAVVAPLLVAAVAAGLVVSGSVRVDAFAAALPWFVAAGALQLFAGLAASGLAAHDRYAIAAAAYAAGAVAGVALFAALPRHGIQALAWGQLLNGILTLAVLLAALPPARARLDGQLRRRLGQLVRGAAVPVALQLLYLIAVTIAGRLGGGEPTSFTYAYFFASFLVSVTASALSIVSSAPLTRRGLSPEAAAVHVINSSWLSLSAIAGAVGVFALVGGRLVAAVLGGAYTGEAGRELGRLVVFFGPWMVASVALTVAFPLLFVAERPRVLVPLAVALPLVQVPIAWGLGEAWGLDGLAISLALTTFAALAVLMGGLSRRTLALATVGLGRLAVLVSVLVALSFGVLAAAVGGIPAAVGGLAAYVLLLGLTLRLGLGDAWLYMRRLHE
jgi:peptidoglycan biosynthesis protein MviN/MurJ (putative lipid II flippase)